MAEEKNNMSNLSSNTKEIKKEVLLNNKNNINNSNNREENYSDEITKINFTPENGDNKISLTEEVYKNLENNINKFLDDRKIRTYYVKHFDQNIKNLYAFIPTIQKRQEKLKTIIPVLDNRKNISRYPYDICLVSYYHRKNNYKQELMKKIEIMSKNLKEEIKSRTRIFDKEGIEKEEEYRN